MADIGGGKVVAGLADSVWLVLAARLMSLVGVPLAAFVFLQVYNSVKDLGDDVQKLSAQVQVMNERIVQLKEASAEKDRKIQVLEDALRRGPN